MTTEETQKVLDELQGVRPEVLNDEAKRLFEAIMKIADERDELKKKAEKQDKIIDLMASEILKLDIKRANNTYDKARIWETEKGIKQYFENKAKEYLKER